MCGSVPQLLQKLGYLTRNVSVVDFPPTDQDMEVQQILRDRLAEHLSAVDALVAGDVAELNALLRSKGNGDQSGTEKRAPPQSHESSS